MKHNSFGPWTTAFSPANGAKLSTYWVRRLKMLPHLRQSSTVLSRRGLYGLLALAMTALLIPSLRGTPAARAVDNGHTTTPAAAADGATPRSDEQAREELLQTYRLAPGQDLKLVPKPRPAGLGAWLNRERPGQGDRLDEIVAMTLRWHDPDHLQRWSAAFGGGWSLSNLPRYLAMDVYPIEIEGDPELLRTKVSGDWVYRQGVSDEQMARSLEAILQRTLKHRVTLQFRQVERDVVVARGRYLSSPRAGRSKNQVEIYGKQVVAGGGGAGEGGGKFPEFLKWVGEWIERPVVSEVEAPPQDLEWYLNARSPFTEQMRREDHDEGLVLQHLADQTGLTFTRERKPIRVLFIERAK